MGSSGHRSNLLNAHLVEVGIGLYAGDYDGFVQITVIGYALPHHRKLCTHRENRGEAE